MSWLTRGEQEGCYREVRPGTFTCLGSNGAGGSCSFAAVLPGDGTPHKQPTPRDSIPHNQPHLLQADGSLSNNKMEKNHTNCLQNLGPLLTFPDPSAVINLSAALG